MPTRETDRHRRRRHLVGASSTGPRNRPLCSHGRSLPPCDRRRPDPGFDRSQRLLDWFLIFACTAPTVWFLGRGSLW